MERAADEAVKRQAEGSEVVEYRPYEDGMLQAEVRIYTRRDGAARSEALTGTSASTREASRRSSTSAGPTTRRRCSPRSGRRSLRARRRRPQEEDGTSAVERSRARA
jgi:hypothetical protein